MRRQPAFFESIRAAAQPRWDQLEGDPELTGPWHLLFKQVQSPRHVLSELLQNAECHFGKPVQLRTRPSESEGSFIESRCLTWPPLRLVVGFLCTGNSSIRPGEY